MIFIFNKNKIFSYVIACSFVLILLGFHKDIISDNDVQLVKVSSNINELNINSNIYTSNN